MSAATPARWRNQFRGMGDAEIKRLRASEDENPRPKKPATDPTPDQQILKQPSEGRRRGAPHTVNSTRL